MIKALPAEGNAVDEVLEPVSVEAAAANREQRLAAVRPIAHVAIDSDVEMRKMVEDILIDLDDMQETLKAKNDPAWTRIHDTLDDVAGVLDYLKKSQAG